MSKFGFPAIPFRLRLIAAFAAVYTIWGSTYLAIRFAVETLPPFLMLGFRFTVAGAILYAWTRLGGTPRPTLLNWRASTTIGGLLLLGGTGLVAWAEQKVPSGLASLLIATVPVWVVLLDWLRPRGTRPNLGVTLGLLLGLAGVGLLVSQGKLANGEKLDMLGVAVVLCAAVSWAAGSLYSRRAPIAESPLLATGMEMLGGGVLLIILATVTGEWSKLRLDTLSVKSALSLGYLVIFGSLVAFTAFIWLLKVSTPSLVSTYAYVNPVVAVFLGWALASEPLSGQTFVAFVIIIVAVAIVTAFRTRKAASPTTNSSQVIETLDQKTADTGSVSV